MKDLKRITGNYKNVWFSIDSIPRVRTNGKLITFSTVEKLIKYLRESK